MKRYEDFVLEAEEGITIEIFDRKDGKIVIKAMKNEYKHYETPLVINGYKHVEGQWNEGFVIERLCDGSQFVWVPVGILKDNGTLNNGFSYCERFGRRDYSTNGNSIADFNEENTLELDLMIKSVKKYGGFYISRYNISKNSITEKPQSVKGEIPWTNVSRDEAQLIAKEMIQEDNVNSHLTFGAEYDSILEWIIESGAKTREEVLGDSTNWGNFGSEAEFNKKIAKTGSNQKWCVKNIYDFNGNVREFTQEKYQNNEDICRGDSYKKKIFWNSNVQIRIPIYPNSKADDIGFRVAIWIK